MKKKDIVLLIIIFLVGVLLRFYHLGAVPKSLNWDEVSWGYNAYSVGMTGKDEYGIFLPLSFKAFGDYKQPIYVYLGVIPTLIWGLSSFAVRFPSALFGALSILVVYFLIRELFYDEKIRDNLSLVITALFAISPWSIQFSRVAFEANIGIFFLLSGITFFLYGKRIKKISLMVFGTLILSISCYTYHSQKVFTPLLFGGLLVFSRNYLLGNKKRLIVLVVAFLLFNSFWILDGRTTARGRSVMFTSQQTEILQKSTEQLILDRQLNDKIGEILHNRRLIYLNKYIQNYLLHFDPNYLFLKGDNPRHHSPGTGILYIVSLPFILIGMVVLWKRFKTISLLIFYWFLLAPVASSLAVDAPNASRSMVFLPIWDIFAGIGIVTFYHSLKQKIVPFVLVGSVICLYLLNVTYYIEWYFGHTNMEYAAYWQDGYEEAVIYGQNYGKNKHLFFTNTLEQPYIFYLFYTKQSPQVYHAMGGSTLIQKPCFAIKTAYFGKCEDKQTLGDLIFSAKEERGNNHLAKVKEILYPNHMPAIYVYKYQQ